VDEGQRWAEEEGLLFVEASAKSGANVEAAFESAARDILSKIRRGVFDDERVRDLTHIYLPSLSAHQPPVVPRSQIVQTCGWRRAGSEQDWPVVLRLIMIYDFRMNCYGTVRVCNSLGYV
jgi:hypothetical protein